MTPEAIGYAQEQLYEGGALDVYTTAIGMKKNRPGILLSCMCHMEKREQIIHLIFKHTTTLGIRVYPCDRYTLGRYEKSIQTEYGEVRIKEAAGWGIKREKAEYEDVARIAQENDLSFTDVTRIVNIREIK